MLAKVDISYYNVVMPYRHVRGNVYIAGSARLSHPYDSAVIVIKGENGKNASIETGSGVNHNAIVKNAAEFGVDYNEITDFYGTHQHAEHVFGFTKANNRAVLRMGAASISALIDRDPVMTAAFLSPGLEPPEFDAARIEPVTTGYYKEYGSTGVRVIETGGHSPGHLAIRLEMDDGNMLYPGDLLYQGGSPLVGTDHVQWKKALEQIPRDYPFDWLLDAHNFDYAVPYALQHWKRGSDMFMSDVKLSHNGLYIDYFGDFRLLPLEPKPRPTDAHISAIYEQNTMNILKFYEDMPRAA